MSKILNPLPEASIAPFDITDAHELACMAVQAYADTYGHALPRGGSSEVVKHGGWVQSFERAAQIDNILVAKLGGQIVGYTQFGDSMPQQATVHSESRELRKLYVAKEMQRRGIGGQLMDAALNSHILQAAPQIYLWVWGGNSKAINFYNRYNFKEFAARLYGDNSVTPPYDLMMVRNQQGAS